MNDPVSYGQFESLASDLSLPDTRLILVGDGSGTRACTPYGWSCLTCDRLTKAVEISLHGGCSGSNNHAELEPYVYALSRWHNAGRGPCRVAIVSDSEVTVRCGEGVYQRRVNGALWASIDWFVKEGYGLHWFHVPRNSNPLSKLCDQYAGAVRRSIATLISTEP